MLIELVAASRRRACPFNLGVVFFDARETVLVGSRCTLCAGHRADYALNLDVFAYGEYDLRHRLGPDGVLLRSLRAAGEATVCRSVTCRRTATRQRSPDDDHAQIETVGLALVDKADVDGILAMDPSKTSAGKVPRVLRIIHTPNDTMDEVRVDQMTRGIALVEQLIRRLDASQ